MYNNPRDDISSSCFPRGRRVQTTGRNVTNLVKNVEIGEFHDHIWNHHEECIKKSTNMPSIGLEIPEISFAISAFFTKL